MSEMLKNRMDRLQIETNENMLEQFDLFYHLLVEWNKVMNLTGITEYEEVVEKHFADSLSLARFLDLNKIHTVIDVGTGAGFPGIPLKIAFVKDRVSASEGGASGFFE